MESKFYIISEMIENRLKELLPQFSSEGIDHKLFTVAVEDFINYVKVKFSVEFRQLREAEAEYYAAFGEMYYDTIKELSGSTSEDLFIKNLFSKLIEEDAQTAKDEIDAWVSLWLAKWKTRVQIIFGNEDMHNKNFNQMLKVSKRHEDMGFQEAKDYKEPVIYALVTNGEIVGTEILSNVIINKTYNKLRSRPREVKDKLQFINECMKEVKTMSFISGKFIFISVKDFDWKVET